MVKYQYQYKKRGILRLLSAPVRYISRKVRSVYKKLEEKNDNNNVEKLQNKSIDKLKGISKLRRIKNRDKLKKEDLKLESSNAERKYM